MPQELTPYEAARARLAQRRSGSVTRPRGSAASRFGDAVYEGAKGGVMMLGKAIRTLGNPSSTVVENMMDVQDIVDDWKKSSAGGRAAIVGENLTGFPLRQMGERIQRGDYAGAVGDVVVPGLAWGLGAKGMRPKTPPKPKPKLLPAHAGPEGRPGPRFTGGEQGLVDKYGPTNGPGRVSPGVGSARHVTVLPREVEPLGPVSDPAVRASYSGAGQPARPLNLPSSAGIDPFSGNAARAFLEALAKAGDKTAIKELELLKKDAGGAGKKRPETNVGKETKLEKNFKGNEAVKETLTQSREARPFAKIRDVDLEALAKAGDKTAIKELEIRKKDAGPVGRLKNERGAVDPSKGIEKLRTNQNARWVEAETDAKKLGIDPKNYPNIEDLEWAITQKVAQETVRTGKNPLHRLLKNERGAVDLSAGVEKLKGQVRAFKKEPLKKTGSILADAQRGALLTGPAILKSALGAVGGVGSELVERAVTQSPRKTLADVKQMVKVQPEAVRRLREAAHGAADKSEAARHLSKPGPLSTPAIRAMATLDAPARAALEGLGLSADDALRRILNASPKSESGKSLIQFLSKHPIIKSIVAPVGSITATNVIEQGLLRTPGVNMTKRVARMDKNAGRGKQIARGALGAGAAYAGSKIAEATGGDDPNKGDYLVRGLLTAIAGPYALPMGLGIAFASEDDLSTAIDNAARNIGREAPVRIPTAKVSTELERRFTPGVVKMFQEEEGRRSRRRRQRRPRRSSD